MHDTLITLDFDHTLFNTTKLVQSEAKHFEHMFGISQDAFQHTREEVKVCCVVEDIDRFVQLLPHPEKATLHTELLSAIHNIAPSCLFEDVLPFLHEADSKADLLLVTHGDPELQDAKIRSSGIPVDIPYAITQSQKSEIITQYVSNYERVLFVDDKQDNLREIKEAHPSVETYLMQRVEDHPYSKMGQVYKGVDHVISDLSTQKLLSL